MRRTILPTILLIASLPLAAQSVSDSLKAVLSRTEASQRGPVLVALVDGLATSQPDDALAYAREASAALEAYPSDSLRLRLDLAVASAYTEKHEPDSALVAARNAITLAERLGDVASAASGYEIEGRAHESRSDFERADADYERSLGLFRRIGHRKGIGDAILDLGISRFSRGDWDRAIDYFEELLEVRQADGDSIGIGWALNNMGAVFHNRGDYDQALVYYERARAMWAASGDADGQAMVLRNVGGIHFRRADFRRAIQSYQQSVAIHRSTGDSSGVADGFREIGAAYRELGDFEKAVQNLQQALSLYTGLGEKRGMANVLTSFGSVYQAWGNLPEALDHFERALAIREETGDRHGTSLSLVHIGAVRAIQGQTGQAIVLFDRALAIVAELGDRAAEAEALTQVAASYDDLGEIDRAIGYRLRAIQLWEGLGDKAGLCRGLLDLADSYAEQERHDEADQALRRALTLATEVGSYQLLGRGYEALSTLAESRGRYEEALEAYKRFKTAEDSLFSSAGQSAMVELLAAYRSEQQRQRIELLVRQQEINTLQRNAAIGGVMLLVIVALLILSRYRIKNQAHEKLQHVHGRLESAYHDLEQSHEALKAAQTRMIQSEKLAALGKLTAGIAHEIKNPLNFVNNFAEMNAELAEELNQELEGRRPEDGTIGELLEGIRSNSRRILEHGRRADGIVASMMQHAAGVQGEPEPTDLNALLDQCLNMAYHAARSRMEGFDAAVRKEYEESLGPVTVERQSLGRAFVGIISNAFEAVDERRRSGMEEEYAAEVGVRTRRIGGNVEVSVSDNGTGIARDCLDHIFEPFFTTKPTGTGTGLGLSIANDIVTQIHRGSIDVQSAPETGTTLLITLPIEEPDEQEAP